MKKKLIPIISITTLVIDQLIKIIITNTMTEGTSIDIINNFFNITYVVNKGAAFSLFSGMQLILIIVAILLLIAIYYMFIKGQNLKKIDKIIYGILIGGILGNLVDRIILNGVVDYLDFFIFGYDAPIFNFADICIVLTMSLLAFKEIGGSKNEH